MQIRQLLAELLPSIGAAVASRPGVFSELVEVAENDPDGVIEAQSDPAAQIHGSDSSERAVGEKRS
ncbi:MAG: hypothetical protein IT305_23805 [Chloroflexi bacterium]|nr:hypothetical protein [Chloroflexota bacterium]